MKNFPAVAASIMLTIVGGFNLSNHAHTLDSAPTRNQSVLAQSSEEIPFEVCGESQSWKRPTATVQRRHLQSMNRYSTEVVRTLGGNYWRYNIISFTTYPGGSGTYDLRHLSGTWTVEKPDRPSTCDNSVSSLISGEIARVWVLLYKVISIKWDGNGYTMVVDQTNIGVQIVNFPRQENGDSLPLKVVTENGKEVPVLFY